MMDKGTVEGLPCLESGKMVFEDVTWTSKVGVPTIMNDWLRVEQCELGIRTWKNGNTALHLRALHCSSYKHYAPTAPLFLNAIFTHFS